MMILIIYNYPNTLHNVHKHYWFTIWLIVNAVYIYIYILADWLTQRRVIKLHKNWYKVKLSSFGNAMRHLWARGCDRYVCVCVYYGCIYIYSVRTTDQPLTCICDHLKFVNYHTSRHSDATLHLCQTIQHAVSNIP